MRSRTASRALPKLVHLARVIVNRLRPGIFHRRAAAVAKRHVAQFVQEVAAVESAVDSLEKNCVNRI